MSITQIKGILIYTIGAPINFTGMIISWLFVNWWAPLFASEEGYLPWWLKWFQTFDASLDQGFVNGTTTEKSRYWRRVHWLYRNPAYGWSYWLLGVNFDPSKWKIVEMDFTKNIIYILSNKGYFCYYFRIWGLEVKLGWKAWNYLHFTSGKPEWDTTPWGPEWRVPMVTSIRILKDGPIRQWYEKIIGKL